MKKTNLLIPLLSIFLSASASVPLKWTVETSRVQPAQIEAYHGETLELEAALHSYGKPLAITNAVASIYWQTNGMGSTYWSAPASVSNHVLRARWTPAMDVGATVYQGFVGLAGEIYRAAFQLRLRQSPGAVPSELPLPVKTLDFAQVTVVNAPYYTRSETDARIIELAPTPGNYATVSNRAMTAVQPAALAAHTTATNNPHNVTAEQVKAVPCEVVNGESYVARPIRMIAEGGVAVPLKVASPFDVEFYYGEDTPNLHSWVTNLLAAKLDIANVVSPTGSLAATGKAADALATKNALAGKLDTNNADTSFNWMDGQVPTLSLLSGYYGTGIGLDLYSGGGRLLNYTGHGREPYGIYFPEKGGLLALTSDIAAAIDHTDIRFSNEVLAVGLNIDTNSVAQINAILNDLGGVPIEGTATTVGGLLLALAAAVAWLRKNALTYARKYDILCGEPIVQIIDKTHVKVLGEISVAVNGKPVYIPHDVTVERGTVQKGKDYAVCLADNGAISVEPYDYDTATIEPTRRILGGFHTICRNVPADYQKPPVSAFGGSLHELAGWSEGDILPKSVWAINFRPMADDPTGMVYAKECDMWIDIYNGSGTIAAPRSRFGGTRLHTHTAVEFMTGYGNLGKWLLDDESFWFAAVGSNCGTKVKGSAQPNPDTTGAHLDTADKPMISSIGCEECCGLQAQWLSDSSVSDGGGWDNSTYPTTAFAGGANAFGSHYNMRLYRAIRAGGAWTESSGVSIGPLHRLGANSRSVAAVDVGGRGACRSTHPCSSI